MTRPKFGAALLTVVSTVMLTVVGGLVVGLDLDAPRPDRVASAAPMALGLELARRIPARIRLPWRS